MDRDIFRGQKMQKVASGVVLHLDSYDLHDIGFFDKNELESLFVFDRFLFLSRVVAVSFAFSEVGWGRDFIQNCTKFSRQLRLQQPHRLSRFLWTKFSALGKGAHETRYTPLGIASHSFLASRQSEMAGRSI
jgi:hypothetical protein